MKGRLTRENKLKKKPKRIVMNQEIKQLSKQMKEQQAEIEELKAKIKKRKSDLETTYHHQVIRQKEDELKDIKRVYGELKREKETMEKMIKKQKKHVKELNEDDEEKEKREAIVVKLKEVKGENKNLNQKVNKLQKETNGIDSKNIKEKLKMREGQRVLDSNKANGKRNKEMKTLQREITDMESEIEQFKKQKEEITNQTLTQFQELEKQKKDKKEERDRLEKVFKEKDKLLRLNVLKLASAKRTKKHNSLEPMRMREDKENHSNNQPKQ